MNNILFAKKIV